MTETEAKTKWCPMVRQNAYAPDDLVAASNAVRGGCCIASACMMWRWADEEQKTHGLCGIAGPLWVRPV